MPEPDPVPPPKRYLPRAGARAKTISIKRIGKLALRDGRAAFPPAEFADVPRPQTRGSCHDGTRPCPFVSCAYHLYLDVNPLTGSIKHNFPDREVWEIEETCTLDVADRGGETLDRVGQLMNITRERVRQIELRALARLHALVPDDLADLVDGRRGRAPEAGPPLGRSVGVAP